MRYTMTQLDNMEGHDFEYAIADLLFHNGWRDVKVTQGSGDYGVDILARRKNVKYGIQCKRYNANVGVKAVQEALSGTEFYHCDAAAVVTNSTYTKQAENLARTSGVRLFGRDFLLELIENYEDEYDVLDPVNAALFAKGASMGIPESAKLEKNNKNTNSTKKTNDDVGCLAYLISFGIVIYFCVKIVNFLSGIIR